MLENALFFRKKKTEKIATALGAPPLNPRWPHAAGGSPKLLLPSLVLITLKLRPIISYLSDGQWAP